MNKNKLVEVLKIQSYSYDQYLMFVYIIRQIKKINCSYYTDNGNIYITKGNGKKYPCIVAHMDTVHPIVEDLTVVELNGNLTGFNAVTMEQTGIGGDDKVGIFIALQCLEKFDNIKIAFFRDEEVGCEGSYCADVDFFNNCNIVLQCDRRGNNDFINNASGVDLSSKDFQKEILPILKNYNYRFFNGAMTDVMALKQQGIKASMANISCGYYNPHQSNEYVNILDVTNCLNLVYSIIEITSNKSFEHKYIEKPIYQKFDFNFKTSKEVLKHEDDFFNGRAKSIFDDCCESCGEIAPLTFKQDYQMNICNNCSNWF